MVCPQLMKNKANLTKNRKNKKEMEILKWKNVHWMYNQIKTAEWEWTGKQMNKNPMWRKQKRYKKTNKVHILLENIKTTIHIISIPEEENRAKDYIKI